MRLSSTRQLLEGSGADGRASGLVGTTGHAYGTWVAHGGGGNGAPGAGAGGGGVRAGRLCSRPGGQSLPAEGGACLQRVREDF